MNNNGTRSTLSNDSLDFDHHQSDVNVEEEKKVHKVTPDIPLDDEPDYVATEKNTFKKRSNRLRKYANKALI
jgi:hypothetical protein